MTCDECRQILFDSRNCMAGEGWMPGVSVLNLAKSHAQTCPACAAEAVEIAELNGAVEQLRLSTAHLSAPAKIEANLLDEFRRSAPVRTTSSGTGLGWKLIWGAAALTPVALALIIYFALRPAPSISVQMQPSPDKPPVKQLSVAQSPAAQRPMVEHRRSARLDRRPPRSEHTAAKVEPAIQSPVEQRSSVPAGEDFSLNGGGNVVRVTLPLSSLASMGVPVRPDMSDRRVTADVAMDPFGAVVAIHLVEVKPNAD